MALRSRRLWRSASWSPVLNRHRGEGRLLAPRRSGKGATVSLDVILDRTWWVAGQRLHGVGRRRVETGSANLLEAEEQLHSPGSETGGLELGPPLGDRDGIILD